MKLRTVAIDVDGVKVIINESDLREYHVRWGASKPIYLDEGQGDVSGDKDELIATLKEHGIEKDRRSSLKNLQKAVRKL